MKLLCWVTDKSILAADLVLKLLSTNTDEEQQTQVKAELDEGLSVLKEIAHTLKKLPVSDKNLPHKEQLSD